MQLYLKKYVKMGLPGNHKAQDQTAAQKTDHPTGYFMKLLLLVCHYKLICHTIYPPRKLIRIIC